MTDDGQTLRVVIAGAGEVGRSIAKELASEGHEILIIDSNPAALHNASVPDVEWLLADACELSSLEEARLNTCHVMVAATGDDKTNLVMSLLAKTEFGVPRTVARVNDPSNEWLFTDMWGVDVPVSMPRIMTAMVEEAVTVGDIVHMFTFQGSGSELLEFTVPPHSPLAGRRVADIPWPADAVLVAVVRGGRAVVPSPDTPVEIADELIVLATGDAIAELRPLLGAVKQPKHPLE